MTTIRPFRGPSLAALVVAGLLAGPGQASAAGGLFDFLGSVFGGGPAGATVEDAPGLDVTVHPQRRKRSIRRLEASRGKPMNTAINPAEHPNWYLEDPTLRRGDIVVLPGGVLVYEGGRGGPADRSDFTSLNRSRLISKADRLKIGSMTKPAGDDVVRTGTAPELLPRTASASPAGD